MTPPISGPSTGLNAQVAIEIRAAQGRQKLSAKALSKKAGIPYSSLRRYLDAERHIDVALLAELASALETTPTEIVQAAQENLARLDDLSARRDRRAEMQQIEDVAARDED